MRVNYIEHALVVIDKSGFVGRWSASGCEGRVFYF